MKHFKPVEFQCRCGCGRAEMDPDFLARLDAAREAAGVPFRITSGFRCPAHNRAVGGVADSAHTKGLAADIAAENNQTRARITLALAGQGFGRLGIAKNFIHVDADPDKPAPALWLY